MRKAAIFLGYAVLAFVVGCESSHRERMNCSERVVLAQDAPARRPTPYLIYDRLPGRTSPEGVKPLTAEDFAYRSNWPSTKGYYSAGDVVYYREWYYDYTGNGYEPYEYVNRQFQSYRYGASYR